MTQQREIAHRVDAQQQQEGAGVTIYRSIGTQELRHFDPFLLLDWFGSNNPDDYIAGFPPHPHRGFITVTYMLDGLMQHEDSTGMKGELKPGSVQWMKAASGIIHSEMPQQKEGLLRGLQLWLNLPADQKMSKPEYQEFDAELIPEVKSEAATVKIISGEYQQQTGPVKDDNTQVFYFDITLKSEAVFEVKSPTQDHVFIFVYEGALRIGDETIAEQQLATLTLGDYVKVSADMQGARFILVGGQPIGESIVQAGPFVMNSKEEIIQAIQDYESERLVQ